MIVAPVTPYYEDDLVTLYHGDCREVTAWLGADVLVTDPPYGVSWSQAAYRFNKGGRTHHTRVDAGIRNDSDTAARDAALGLFGDTRPAAVFGSPLLGPPSGCRQVLVWQKAANSGLFGTVAGFRRDVEAIYLVGPWPALPPQSGSVITSTGSVNAAGVAGHPHAKPTALMEILIGRSQGGVVADPFAGSGSTLLAAKGLGQKAVGVEIDERYCEIAARRLSQDTLFGEAS